MLRVVFAALAIIPLVAAQCPASGASLSFQGPCTLDNIKTQTGCDVGTDMMISVEDLQEACDASAFNFSSVTDETRNFDSTYFDGGGPFNNDLEGVDSEQSVSASRIIRVRNNIAPSKRILMPEYDSLRDYTYVSYFGKEAADPEYQETNKEGLDDFPPYLSQFNLTSECALNSIMCCFTDERMGTTLEDNADVCTHDLSNSAKSSHVRTGFGVFDSSVPTYCTAFKWDDDENSASYQYRGNALFDLSFGTFLDKGYVKNIPGAPMCSCLENMPVVTNAACRTLEVANEKYTLSFSGGSNITITQDEVAVTYKDCGEDFKTFHNENDTEDAASALDQHIVDSCVDTQSEFLNDHFLISVVTNQFDTPAQTKWAHVAGKGIGYYPTKTHNVTDRDVEFREKFDKSPNGIIYRHCPTCRDSHQHIYYRRLTNVPDEMNFINLFLNDWTSANNTLHVDFELYSTYDDAINETNDWKYCNYDDRSNKVGFPRDCGPERAVGCQWNTHADRRSPCGPRYYSTRNHAFYIEMPDTAANVEI